MSDPRPIRLSLLAKRLHLPEAEIRQAMHDLCSTWGSDRVIAATDGFTVRLTAAAVMAIQQAFGLAHLDRTARRAS